MVCGVVIFETLFGCHDILILGYYVLFVWLCLDNTSPIKVWQRHDMTIAVDWDVKHQFNQTNKDTESLKVLNFTILVPGPPANVWFPLITFTEATIFWELPMERNGIITGYMVTYKLKNGIEPYQNSSVLTNDTTSYTVENLQREAYYTFGVTAKTRFGWGETASVDVYTMENRSKDLIYYCNQCYNMSIIC